MNPQALDQLVNTVLYEGYVLYPYRPSSKKNQRERFTFGRVYPHAYSAAQHGREPSAMQTECLLRRTGARATLEITVGFLQPMWREIGKLTTPDNPLATALEPQFDIVPELLVNGRLHQTWQEAVEQKVRLPARAVEAGRTERSFSFLADRSLTPLEDQAGRTVAMMVRRQAALRGRVEVEMKELTEPKAPAGASFRITIRVHNLTPMTAGELPDSDAVLMRTFASTHVILHTPDAQFVSLLEPPPEYEQAAVACKHIGAWPVLVGEAVKSECDTMLASPIILYDYPQIAPESGGDFCDGTEMDEMLTLRVLTMTDTEKREMRELDGFARRILERAENLPPENFLKLHGTLREVRAAADFFNPRQRVDRVRVQGVELKAGDRVRIRPNHRADAMDLILSGKTAIVEAVEQDAEDHIHLAVVLEDDPGRDLGLSRQPGHRFFYAAEEVEPMLEEVVQ